MAPIGGPRSGIVGSGVAIPDSVIYRWPVQSGSGDVADTVDSLPLTNNGATWVSDQTSVGRYHLSLDGTGDYLDGGNITPPPQFSVGGWFRFDSVGGDRDTLIDLGHSGANDDNIQLLMADGDIGSAGSSDGEIVILLDGADLSTGYTPTAGTWNHYGVTYASNGDLEFYVDGSPTFSTNTGDGSLNDSGNPLTIGARAFDQGGAFLQGDFDDGFVADSPLSQSEMNDILSQSPRA